VRLANAVWQMRRSFLLFRVPDLGTFGGLSLVAALITRSRAARPRARSCAGSLLSLGVVVPHAALNWLRLGAPERGLSCAEEAVKLKPQALCGHVACAAVLAAVDRAHDAQAALAGAVALKPHLDHAFVEAMIAYTDPTDAERFRVSLSAAGLKESGA